MNNYDSVNLDVLERLPVKGEPFGYVYTNSKNEPQVGHILKVDKSDYDKVIKLLEGKDNWKLEEGDKVFVLPNYPLDQKRLKQFLKKKKVSIVKDISKATKVLGSESFYDKIEYKQPNQHCIMFSGIGSSYVYKTSFNVSEQSRFITSGYTEEQVNELKTCEGFYIGYRAPRQNLGSTVFGEFITNECLNILFNVLSKRLPVVSQKVILDEANSNVQLNETSYKTIKAMIESSDSANKQLGVEMLIHSDYSKTSMYLLKEISSNFYTISKYGKTKSGKAFITNTKLNELYYADDLSFYEMCLTEKGAESLTAEEFKDISDKYVQLVIDRVKKSVQIFDKTKVIVTTEGNDISVRLTEKVLSLQKSENVEI